MDLAKAVRNLIARLEPGETLRFDEDNGTAYYQRRSRDDRGIERVWLDGNVLDNSVADVIEPELAAMVSRGELVDGEGCSEWMRPRSA